ncbi:calponin homology domain-containing protein [Neohortaea acidophila]|uniref:Calponin homology domain-containing protein n=1 Tax=Neohortaea acidophila TaxID=245834 RepID=A0A6A6Q244_9PEZI|nr:calponin homology domain-containing protein [Neohortaea acidophila]KAF2486470.1 calponin homology domain-containing protein [Neohortaea acidophila]
MGESRQELLGWMNSLLQLNMTKVEQCGTGAALCQIYDSIYLDLPMARVKFNANNEYSYLENFKILSNTFRKHAIDRPIPVQDLIKCKMQDNLEFLQWSKRYWDQYYPGGDYDAIARRKGAGGAPAMPVAGGGGGGGRTSGARRPVGSAGVVPRTTSRQTGGGSVGAGTSGVLQQKNAELMETVQGLERERDFYFSKLRDIELLIQQAMEAEPSLEEDEGSLLKQIQTILYSTEEGFEIPQEAEAGELAGEEETF